jgi:branched-chain amino acid transport system ATP-binding protein
LERRDPGSERRRGMTTPALELEDIKKSFGATEIIRGVSLAVAAGERHAIIGPNGAGKTTLFNLICGRLAASAGHIRLLGRSIDGLRPYEINRRGLSRSFQVTNVFPRLTVYDNLRCATLWKLGYRHSFWTSLAGRRDAAERANALAERVGLAARLDVPAGVLTYAEQRALEIGLALGGDPEVLLLDEPTAGMSHRETDAMTALIRTATAGKALVIVEHDMSVVFDLADRISVLVYGRIIASGTPESIRANPEVQRAYLGPAEGA